MATRGKNDDPMNIIDLTGKWIPTSMIEGTNHRFVIIETGGTYQRIDLDDPGNDTTGRVTFTPSPGTGALGTATFYPVDGEKEVFSVRETASGMAMFQGSEVKKQRVDCLACFRIARDEERAWKKSLDEKHLWGFAPASVSVQEIEVYRGQTVLLRYDLPEDAGVEFDPDDWIDWGPETPLWVSGHRLSGHCVLIFDEDNNEDPKTPVRYRFELVAGGRKIDPVIVNKGTPPIASRVAG